MPVTDKTPMVGYGELVLVPATSTVYIVLYPIPDYTGDAEFLVEDSEENLFLDRIVGTINVVFTSSENLPDLAICWRLMPLGLNYDTQEVLEPFSVPFFAQSSEWANLKWWVERYYVPRGALVSEQGPLEVDHPWWTNVDYRPRMMMGAGRNLWPVLAVRNPYAQDIRVEHRLTAFWRYS